jgi:nucleotide-binding universal stress UspA family protein
MSTLAFRRILVAIDASTDSLAALGAVTQLAAELGAELIGLFIEDINLIHIARLPYAQEVGYPMASTRQVSSSRMERQLRAQAAKARQELAREADKGNVAWSFRVARGPVSGELLAAAIDADLLVLGRISRSLIQTARLGSTARTAIAQAPGPVLLMGPRVDLKRPVLLIYDGSDVAQRALAVASYLAQVSGRLRVLIFAESDERAREYEHDINHELAEQPLSISYRRIYQLEPGNLAYVLGLSSVDLLVLGSNARLPTSTIQFLLEELDHPVLIVN